MYRVVDAKALDGFRVELAFDDGVRGTVDLSPLVGEGVFAAWAEPGRFAAVSITSYGALSWGDEIELCPDALYLDVTKKTPEEIFPKLSSLSRNA